MLESAGISEEVAAKATFMRGKGCGHCGKSGYRGRMGIYELMLMSTKVREAAFQQTATQDIRKLAVAQGMKTLYEDGIAKALKGLTSIEEVFRVAKKLD